MNQGVDQARERIARGVAELRETLPKDTQVGTVDGSKITAEELRQLADLGGGTLGCVLLMLEPNPLPGGHPRPEDPGRDERMLSIAMQLLGQIVRRGDLITRVSSRELAGFMPGSGPLEARAMGHRLAQEIEGKAYYYADERLTMHCRIGLSSRATAGKRFDVPSLLDAARRNPLH
jgi:hypothetical protein